MPKAKIVDYSLALFVYLKHDCGGYDNSVWHSVTLLQNAINVRLGYGLPLPKTGANQAAFAASSLTGADLMVDKWPMPSEKEFVTLQDALRQAKANEKRTALNVAHFDRRMAHMLHLVDLANRTALARAIDTPEPMRERLVAFFGDHFTVSARGRVTDILRAPLCIEYAIRPNIGGRFVDMLKAAVLHPSMLLYLNQNDSVGPNSKQGLKTGKGLNENLARELIELHSLGVGADYTQTDVRELAKLLTGIVVDQSFAMEFSNARAEPGPKTVLGVTYDGKGLDTVLAVLDDLARHPATAAHVSRKMAVHFISDTPDPKVVAAIEDAYLTTGGDIPAMVTAMVQHPAFLAQSDQKLRQPVEMVVAACRALGVTGADIMALTYSDFTSIIFEPLRLMGQKMFSPRGPDGWPEEAETWVTSQFLAARINWAMTAPQQLRGELPDPVEFAKAALGARASDALITAVSRAEDRRAGVGIVLASPEFNRR